MMSFSYQKTKINKFTSIKSNFMKRTGQTMSSMTTSWTISKEISNKKINKKLKKSCSFFFTKFLIKTHITINYLLLYFFVRIHLEKLIVFFENLPQLLRILIKITHIKILLFFLHVLLAL